MGSAEHGDHQRVHVELTLMGGTEDAREDSLGGGTMPGPIAAAHFARDHGGPQRLLGAPIRGICSRNSVLLATAWWGLAESRWVLS